VGEVPAPPLGQRSHQHEPAATLVIVACLRSVDGQGGQSLKGPSVQRDLVGSYQRQLSAVGVGRQFFLAALELLRDPQAFYEQGGTSLKRAMNKIIFAKLFVDGEEISGHELGETVCATWPKPNARPTAGSGR
jgi:hypothetical protein